MSLLTSLYPFEHGVVDGGSYIVPTHRIPTLRGDAVTLAQALRDRGFLTLASTGGGTVAGVFGFERGFDVFQEGVINADPGGEAEERLDTWLRWNREIPFFVFFHTFEVHAPYLRAELAGAPLTEWQRYELQRTWQDWDDWPDVQANRATAFADLLRDLGLYRADVTSALYDAGIRSVDRFLGRLFEVLRARGLYDNTLIIVTSDHGEEFGDRDPGRFYDAHCLTQFDEMIHVPLIMRLPGRVPAGTVVSRQVELVDVAPTVLEMVGAPVPPTMRGHNLLGALSREAGKDTGRPSLSEATCSGPEIKALRTPDYKYMAAFDVERGSRQGLPGKLLWERLYDLRLDPSEKSPLAGGQEGLLASRRGELLKWLANPSAARTNVPASEETLEALRSLGYVQP